MNEELMLKAREEYMVLPQEEQTKYLAQLADTYGQDFVDAFTSFMETGNFPKFAAQVTTTPEFPAGELKEIPGMANGYERTMEEVAASLNTEHAPVYEVIMSMGNELNAAPPVKQAEMMDQLASARGQEFSEAVYYTFKHPDFCEYIAKEAQSFFDTLAGDLSQSKDQVSSLLKIGNFSETLSKGVLSYATKGKPGNFSILESVALLSSLARRDFSDNGELAEAIMELGEGDVSPEGAETLADNIEQYADGDTEDVPEQIQEIAAQADDVPPTQQEEQKDMSESAAILADAKARSARLAADAAQKSTNIFRGQTGGPQFHATGTGANVFTGQQGGPMFHATEAGPNAAFYDKVNELNNRAIEEGKRLSSYNSGMGFDPAIRNKAVNPSMLDKLKGAYGSSVEWAKANPWQAAAIGAGAAAVTGAGIYGLKKLHDRKKAAKAIKAANGPDMSQNDFNAVTDWFGKAVKQFKNPITPENAGKYGYKYTVDPTSTPYVGAQKEYWLRKLGHPEEIGDPVQKIVNVKTPYDQAGVMDWVKAHPLAAAGIGAGVVGAGVGAGVLANQMRKKRLAKAMSGAFSEQDIATSQPIADAQAPAEEQQAPVDDQTVMREKEQNNAMLDAIVEKYKALQSEEAKALMVQEMQQILDPELVQYIISRAESEDFSEEEQPVDQVAQAPVEGQGVAPAEPVDAESGDVDKYEELSKQLLGQYEEDPIGKVVASEAPVAVATLPEGAPVAATEGGTTMAEDYEREPIIDKYEEMGLI